MAAQDRKGNGSVMFSIGERVVHPVHGAGIIVDIVQEKLSGSLREYYVFKTNANGLTLKIPISGVRSLRPVMTHAEVEALFARIPLIPSSVNSNWNKRYQENVARLKSGDLNEVISVIKSLMLRGRQRALSTGEWKMLHSAKQLIVSEVVLVEGCSAREAEARLDRAVIETAED